MPPQLTQDSSIGLDLLMDGVAAAPEGASFRLEVNCCDTLTRVKALSELAAQGRLSAAHLSAELTEIQATAAQVTLSPTDSAAIIEEMRRLKGFSREDPTLKDVHQLDSALDTTGKIIQNEAAIFSLRERASLGEISPVEVTRQIDALRQDSQTLTGQVPLHLNTSIGFDPLADLLDQSFEVAPPPVLAPPCCALREVESLAVELSSVLADSPNNRNHIRELTQAIAHAAERAITEGNQRQVVSDTLGSHLSQDVLRSATDRQSPFNRENVDVAPLLEKIAPLLSPKQEPHAPAPPPLPQHSIAPPDRLTPEQSAPVVHATRSIGDASASLTSEPTTSLSAAPPGRLVETVVVNASPPAQPPTQLSASPVPSPKSVETQAYSSPLSARSVPTDTRPSEVNSSQIQPPGLSLQQALPISRSETAAVVDHLSQLRREHPSLHTTALLAGELGTRVLTILSQAELKTLERFSQRSASALGRELSLLVQGLRLSDHWSRSAARMDDSSLNLRIARGLAAAGVRCLTPEDRQRLALLARQQPELLGRHLTSLLQANRLLASLTRIANSGSTESLHLRLSKMLASRGVRALPPGRVEQLSRMALRDPSQFLREVSALLRARELAVPPRLKLASMLTQAAKGLTDLAPRIGVPQLANRISETLRLLGVSRLPQSSLTALARLARQDPQGFSRTLKNLYRLEMATPGSILDRLQKLSHLIEKVPRPLTQLRAHLAQSFSLRELTELRKFLRSPPEGNIGGLSRRSLLLEVNAARAFLKRFILAEAQGVSFAYRRSEYRLLLSEQRRLLTEFNRLRPARNTLVSRSDPHLVALVSRITEIETALSRYANDEIENDQNIRTRRFRRLSIRARRLRHRKVLKSPALGTKPNPSNLNDAREARRRKQQQPSQPPPMAIASKTSTKGKVTVVAAKRTPSRSLDVVQSEQKDGQRNSYYDFESEDPSRG